MAVTLTSIMEKCPLKRQQYASTLTIGRTIWLTLALALPLVSGCVTLTTTHPTPAHLTPADTLAVWIEFDTVPLTPLFLDAFREHGLPVASSKDTAQVLLTGAYSANWDLIHYRVNWAQLRLIRPTTGEVLLLLETGQGGIVGIEAVVTKMVAQIQALYE